jgi:hypothetical protein
MVTVVLLNKIGLLHGRIGAGTASKSLPGARAASKWCGSATLSVTQTEY